MHTILYYPLLDTKKNVSMLQDYIDTNPSFFTDDIQKASAILVAGGDGYMLHALKQYHHYNIPFVGVNFGRLGFLLNDIIDYETIPKYMKELTIITQQLPHITVIDRSGKEYTTYMVNDVIVGGSVLDYFDYTVSTQSDTYHIQGTALIVSTAIGSTAYWLSNGGPIIDLDTNMRGIMGVATLPFHYKLVAKTTITIDIESTFSSIVWVDGYGIVYRDIQHVIIQPSTISVRLGFLKTYNFAAKRKIISVHKSVDI